MWNLTEVTFSCTVIESEKTTLTVYDMFKLKIKVQSKVIVNSLRVVNKIGLLP